MKQRPFPSPRVLLSRGLKRYYGRLRRPPGTPPTSREQPVIGRDAPTASLRRPPGRGGPPQFPPPPSERSTPHTPGGSSGPHIQALHPFHGLHPDFPGSAPPCPPKGRVLTTRQASLHAADRSVAPPEGLSTLGFDPARFPTEPPACYRASWQLPGRDSHPLATTSLCWIRSTHQPPPTLGARSGGHRPGSTCSSWQRSKIRSRSRHSRRALPTQRSMCAFAFGARTGVRMTFIPSPWKMASTARLNFVSRSWIRNRGRWPL